MPGYLAEEESDSYEWIIEGLLPRSYLVIWGGTSKSGKSCILTDLGIRVARGEPFLGCPTTRSAVLWLALEESESERRAVLRLFDPLPNELYISHERITVDSTDGLKALRYWVRRTGASLIIIDPLYACNSADTLSDGSKARQVLAGLKELCRTENISTIMVHHVNKNVSVGMTRERFADSNQIIATASMDVLMDSTVSAQGVREIKLACRGRGDFANRTLLIRSTGVTHYELMAEAAGTNAESSLRYDRIMLEIQKVGESGLCADEIAERLGMNTKTVRNRLTELIKARAIVVCDKRGSTSYYCEAPVPED